MKVKVSVRGIQGSGKSRLLGAIADLMIEHLPSLKVGSLDFNFEAQRPRKIKGLKVKTTRETMTFEVSDYWQPGEL